MKTLVSYVLVAAFLAVSSIGCGSDPPKKAPDTKAADPAKDGRKGDVPK